MRLAARMREDGFVKPKVRLISTICAPRMVNGCEDVPGGRVVPTEGRVVFMDIFGISKCSRYVPGLTDQQSERRIPIAGEYFRRSELDAFYVGSESYLMIYMPSTCGF